MKLIVKFTSSNDAKRVIETFKKCNRFKSCDDCPLCIYAGEMHETEHCVTIMHRAYAYLADNNEEYYE